MEITIKKIEKKKAKNGSEYLVLETSTGKMSCWKKEYFDLLAEGNIIEAKTEENNGYTMITEATLRSTGLRAESTASRTTFKSEDTTASVLTAYTKDLLCSWINHSVQAEAELAASLPQVAIMMKSIIQQVYDDHKKHVTGL